MKSPRIDESRGFAKRTRASYKLKMYLVLANGLIYYEGSHSLSPAA